MEKEKKYDDLVAGIRSIEPVLEGEDELSAEIMRRIGRPRLNKKILRGTRIAGWASAVAAIFLAVVMINEIFVVPPTPIAGTAEHVDRRLYTESFRHVSKDGFIAIAKEHRKRDKEKKRLIDQHIKKMQDHEK